MTTDNFADLSQRLEDAANKIFEVDLKLNGLAAVYLVRASETPFNYDGGRFNGVSNRFLHHLLQEDIAHRWRGTGPCVLIEDRYLSTQRAKLSSPDDHFIGAVIHEFGHTANTDRLCHDEPPANFTRTDFAKFTSTPDDKPEIESLSTRYGHDWRWIRCVLHLRHRFEKLGFKPQIPLCINNDHYGYFSIADYWRALESELDRLIEMPFACFPEVPPTAEFLEIWEDNMRRVPTWTYENMYRGY